MTLATQRDLAGVLADAVVHFYATVAPDDVVAAALGSDYLTLSVMGSGERGSAAAATESTETIHTTAKKSTPRRAAQHKEHTSGKASLLMRDELCGPFYTSHVMRYTSPLLLSEAVLLLYPSGLEGGARQTGRRIAARAAVLAREHDMTAPLWQRIKWLYLINVPFIHHGKEQRYAGRCAEAALGGETGRTEEESYANEITQNTPAALHSCTRARTIKQPRAGMTSNNNKKNTQPSDNNSNNNSNYYHDSTNTNNSNANHLAWMDFINVPITATRHRAPTNTLYDDDGTRRNYATAGTVSLLDAATRVPMTSTQQRWVEVLCRCYDDVVLVTTAVEMAQRLSARVCSEEKMRALGMVAAMAQRVVLQWYVDDVTGIREQEDKYNNNSDGRGSDRSSNPKQVTTAVSTRRSARPMMSASSRREESIDHARRVEEGGERKTVVTEEPEGVPILTRAMNWFMAHFNELGTR